MALQAERVCAGGGQHAGVGGAVWGMTRRTTLNLDRLVFENERPTLVAMAFEADCILIRRGAKLAYRHRTVRVVAIRAFDQPLLHGMMEGFLEIGFLLGVAGEAQRRLLLHQLIFQLGVMDGVAGGTGDAILVMGGAHELPLLSIGLVTGQTTLGDFFRLRAFEDEDLALIATTLDMGRTGAMAGLAAMNLFAPDLGEVGAVMGAGFNTLELIFVAALAGFRAHELRSRIRSTRGIGGRASGERPQEEGTHENCTSENSLDG